MTSELLETDFWNCAVIMFPASADSTLLSVDEFIVREVKPVAVTIMGSIIANKSIQTTIIAYLRFVINRPILPNKLAFSCAISVTAY
jgi:hypothetical protein